MRAIYLIYAVAALAFQGCDVCRKNQLNEAKKDQFGQMNVNMLVKLPGVVGCLAPGPSGKRVAVAIYSTGATIPIIDVATGSEARLSGVLGIASRVAFSPTAEYLACSCYDHVQLWRLTDNSLVRTFDFASEQGREIAFSQDGRDLFVGCLNGQVRRISLATWEVTTIFRETEQKSVPLFVVNRRPITSVFELAVSPDDRTLAIGLRNGVVLFDLIKGIDRCGLVEEENASDNLVFSRDGKTLVVATGVFATAWDVLNGTKIRVFHGPPGTSNICGVGISSDDRYFVAGVSGGVHLPGKIAIWALRGGDPVVVDAGTSLVTIALLPKTDIVVTGSMDGTMGALDLSQLFRGK